LVKQQAYVKRLSNNSDGNKARERPNHWKLRYILLLLAWRTQCL